MKKIFFIILVLTIAVATVVGWRYFSSSLVTQPQQMSSGTPAVSVSSTPEAVGLVVVTPASSSVISSPFAITGYVNGGGWYGFEGQVGSVTVYDNTGMVLDMKPLTATSDWMTSTVRFEAHVEFMTTATSGVLVFKNENASGEQSRDKTVTMPVQFAPMGATSKVTAYFVNNTLDQKMTCARVFPVTRLVPKTESVAKAALLELFKGPTNVEKQAGYETTINSGVTVRGITIVNGVATVDLDEVLDANVAGSCRVGLIRLQIEETLKQFATVKTVIISVNGNSTDILQP